VAYAARHAGRVNEQGMLVLADPAAWRAAVARHRGRAVWVTVRRQQHSRSPQANKFYWGVVVDSIASYIGESSEDTHELLKAKFLPGRSIELLDGRSLEMPPSTRQLSVEAFASYIDAVKVWAAQFLGLSIPDPGQVEVL
jgi:hypothetical protein